MLFRDSGKFMAVAIFLFSLFVGVFATSVYANHSWGPYHWARTANPFTVKLGDNVSTLWDSHLAVASADWSESSVLDTSIVPGKSKGNCQPTKGRVEVCSKTYGNNGWLGLAQIWVSGSHITQGVAKMNDTYFNTATYNNPTWRQYVICQEVGHNFGLGHQDEDFNNTNLDTCMDYTSDPSTNQHPNQHDYDELDIIYTHLDNITTLLDKKSPGNASVSSEWGKAIRSDSAGRPSLYVRDLGQGEKVFTFVIWAN